MRAICLVLLALLPLALGGCAVVAVTGAVVGVGVAATTAVVKTGVAVGKGAVTVATYPFRDSEEEKAAQEAEQRRQREAEGAR